MSHTLGQWNRTIFVGQIILLAIVAGAATITHSSSQSAVIGGLLSVIVFTAVSALSAMKQERDIVLDLCMGNACGIASTFFFVFAVINHGSAPANVAPTLYLGGAFFLLISAALAESAARITGTLVVQESVWKLRLMAAPIGIGPVADMIMRRRADSVCKKK